MEKKVLFRCINERPRVRTEWAVPDTKEVYVTRNRMKGLVIGPLDKNNGELWNCCPILYHRALRKSYSEATGYQTVYPAKLSAYRRKRYSVEELPEQIMREAPPPTGQGGGERDIVEMIRMIYKRRGWDKYARFERNGGFNQPYILFKAKNVIDPSVRQEKWHKARPIAPGTKHPARRLLHYVGRAWSFVTARMEGEGFTIQKGSQVPGFLREAEALASKGDLGVEVLDIEGCFPNMPKETIRFAMRKVLADLRREQDVAGVYVPTRSDKQPCAWESRRRGMQYLPFQVMLDVMEFSLDLAMVKMPDGAILRQGQGIPMGDPLSPAMTIGTCAWMEDEWMQTLSEKDKEFFKAKRYMDDILVVYAKSEAWDHGRFMSDLKKSVCYQAPLKLEPGAAGTFLETRYEIVGNQFRYKLKNDNESGETRVWRYQHFHSYSPFMQKRATLTACLQKVQHMASDPDTLYRSALAKVDEFRRLDYPLSVLRKACSYLGASTGEGKWIAVRNALR